MKKSFTLIEILVVVTIIGLLTAGAAVSYSRFNQQSRDAKRKADLEQVKAAIEMFRSNNANSSYPETVSFGSTGGITDGTNTYLEKVPQDPLNTSNSNITYIYESTCIDGLCSDYILGALLETGGTCSSPPSADCDNSNPAKPCNYCLGPYGEK